MILLLPEKHFGDKDGLITPLNPLKMETEEKDLATIFYEKSFQKMITGF